MYQRGWLCIVGHNYNYISVVVVFFFKICSAILNVIPAQFHVYLRKLNQDSLKDQQI